MTTTNSSTSNNTRESRLFSLRRQKRCSNSVGRRRGIIVKRTLLVTTESDLSADLVVSHLTRRGIPFVRFNQEDFPAHISVIWPGDCEGATITVRGNAVPCSEIRSAWFRNSLSPPSTGLNDQITINFVERERTGCLLGLWVFVMVLGQPAVIGDPCQEQAASIGDGQETWLPDFEIVGNELRGYRSGIHS